MPHPLVDQLRFARSEFLRGLEGLSEADATCRVEALNSISWNVGHLAWQEQRFFVFYPGGEMPLPTIDEQFRFGGPPSTPLLAEMLEAWRTVTRAADPWLDEVTTALLQSHVVVEGRTTRYLYGSLLQRTLYHYWFHNGENAAIRQALGHTDLPQFVGDIDTEAPYTPEPPA